MVPRAPPLEAEATSPGAPVGEEAAFDEMEGRACEDEAAEEEEAEEEGVGGCAPAPPGPPLPPPPAEEGVVGTPPEPLGGPAEDEACFSALRMASTSCFLKDFNLRSFPFAIQTEEDSSLSAEYIDLCKLRSSTTPVLLESATCPARFRGTM